MKLAISGTYSSGKTTTAFALSHLVGIPTTGAKAMREILPVALPGKRLEECAPGELMQLFVRRTMERAVKESHLDAFISDGSSLNEWVYGMVRVRIGMHPKEGQDFDIPKTESVLAFEDMITNFGSIAREHAKNSYSEFIHLPIEFPLAKDGHRPVSERFRSLSDELLLKTLIDHNVKYTIVGGSIEERLEQIVKLFGFKKLMSFDEALALAYQDIETTFKEIECSVAKM
ncbi:MAG: ATP/GTP-binding protein [Gammaproteobacteria bacterium GWF2_41_13]|nr:MAG: ATP/GTP-binding protein [Gammaproteobacteria bacterium GWF2_41_13]